MQMKSLKMKLVLSALGIVAMLTSPAFAQTRHHRYLNRSAVTAPIPGYDKDGGVVGIANPDQPY
jgi:hypothetical protein